MSEKVHIERVVSDTWNGGSISVDELRRRAVEVLGAAGTGDGVHRVVDHDEVYVGTPAYLAEAGMVSCSELDEHRLAEESTGHTVRMIGWGNRVRGMLVLE